MEHQEIKELLEKQLQLLSERSQKGEIDLVAASQAMCSVASLWARLFTEEGRKKFSY